MKKPVSLAALREIGWSTWDPIGLFDMDGSGRPPPGAVDEYDSYLGEAARMLRAGCSDDDVISYLIMIERQHMAVARPGTLYRARNTVEVMKTYLEI